MSARLELLSAQLQMMTAIGQPHWRDFALMRLRLRCKKKACRFGSRTMAACQFRHKMNGQNRSCTQLREVYTGTFPAREYKNSMWLTSGCTRPHIGRTNPALLSNLGRTSNSRPSREKSQNVGCQRNPCCCRRWLFWPFC